MSSPRLADPLTLRSLAAAHGGVFTAEEARSCGWSPSRIRADVERGLWRRLDHGLFVEAPVWEGFDAAERHVLLIRARLRAHAEGWMAARRSAALLHGLPLLGALPSRPQLVRDRWAASDRGSLRHERVAPVPPCDVVKVRGLPVTSLARTVVDLAREESLRSAVVLVDAALHAGLSEGSLVELLDRCARWPGHHAARRAVALADGRAESPLESISRLAFVLCGLPAPRSQVEVYDGPNFVARVDFLWDELRVVGEADGRVKYSSPEDFLKEKQREEFLRELGFEVVRWGWQEAWHPRGVLDVRLQRAFARGIRHELDPAVRLVQAPLRAGTRSPV